MNKRCLRFRSKNSRCDLCVQVCSSGAIKMHAGKPVRDEVLCENCGLCEVYCPTKAIEGRKKNIPYNLRYACSQAGPVVNSGLVVCLAGLTAVQILNWLSAETNRNIKLYKGNCSECNFSQAMEIWQQKHLKEVNNWLKLGGFNRGVNIIEQKRDSALSRRELLGWLTGKVVLQIDNLLPDSGSQDQSEWEQILKVNKGIADKVPTRILKIAGNCEFCDVCHRICPLQALGKRKINSREELYWQGKECTECNLCLDTCPKRALVWAEGNWAERGQEKVLESKEILKCPTCGREIKNECTFCSLGEEIFCLG